MMPPSRELGQELERAEKDLHRMVERHFGTASLSREEVQKGLTGRMKEQRIVVAWLRAEYLARCVDEMRERIGEAEADRLLETSGLDSEAEIEGERSEKAELRLQAFDAYILLDSLDGWEEVAKRYEHSRGR